MIIQCTKTVLEKLNVPTSNLVSPEGYEQFPESLMSWHANIVTIHRRKVLILMNNEARYPVVINGLLKKDVANIQTVIQDAIRLALQMEGVKDSMIEHYLTTAGDITFSKTASRSMIAKMNNVVRDVENWSEFIDKTSTMQRYISLITSKMIQMDKPKDAFFSKDRMLESLALLNNVEIHELLDVELYELNIQLALPGHQIWRRVNVPSNFSFRHLHNIIQRIFDWQNSHLHEFTVTHNVTKPLRILMDDDPETLDYVDPHRHDILQERFVSLKDIFSKHAEVAYHYDFGDDWTHIITVEKTVRANEMKAVFLDGAGTRPPEDVGGLFGFNEYLQIINDPTDENYESMKMWAASQIERPITVEQKNKKLESALFNYYYYPHT